MASADSSNHDHVYLPDFLCGEYAVIVVLVAELVAIVLSLAAYGPDDSFLLGLSKASFFVLWIALLGSAVMCQLRPRLERAGPKRAFVIAFLILEAMSLLVAEIAWQLTRIFGESAIIDDPHGTFLLRTFAISSIVIALGMRYLYISSEWRRSIVLEAQARISALQALIRPHFLFNSMNTIAALTRSDPARAEEARLDLSDLLRANLSSSGERATLKQELETAAIYQRIEKLRLGDRLTVRWDVADLPMRATIPSLTIQPLLENAIYHGIELLPDGGEVTVSASNEGDELRIRMSNPVASGEKRASGGNNMAMSNIRQRFELAYGSKGGVEVLDEGDRFTVELRFPGKRADGMKILIVDDEQPARDRLRTILDDEAGLDCVGTAENGHAALQRCAELQPDVILLDIRMPGMDGIETAHHLNSLESPPAVVFTTAYDEYAIEAFDARAQSAVLKPVRRAKLLAALQHASRLAPAALANVAAESQLDSARNHVCARAHGELRLIPIEEVVCFVADQKYVSVHHAGGEDLIDDSLKSLEAEFASRFVRIHRSMLVALAAIDRIEKGTDGKSYVVLRDNSQLDSKGLIISRRHLADVRRQLKNA